MNEETLTFLRDLYRELDAELEGSAPICEACGACCHFAKAGHRLYASAIEASTIARHVPLTGVRPEADPCPFLRDGGCTIRLYRTLSCRVFFCAPEYADGRGAEICERYLARLKAYCRERGLAWRYAPLFALLAEMGTEAEAGP